MTAGIQYYPKHTKGKGWNGKHAFVINPNPSVRTRKKDVKTGPPEQSRVAIDNVAADRRDQDALKDPWDE